MSNLVTLLRQSVVDISAFTVDAAGSTVTNYGTAFFIYKDFLITSASVVIVDNRKPPSNYYIQRAQRITGVVHSTNDSNTEVIMKLIGISPINDIAVLQAINPPAHSVLSWGNSQTSVPGITVYTIGNLLNEDPLALSSGVLRDNSLSYIANPNMAQLIDTDIALGGGMGGAPIVDGSGNVLGVVSFTVNWLQQSGYLISTGTVVGVSQYTAQFIFEQMAEARYCELIIDPLGNWLRWMPTSFGASFKYVQAIDLITLNQGLASTITNATPETLQAPFVLDNVKGAMVTGLTPGSDLANYLYEGDIIESVFGFPIGYETSKQLSISGALWTIIPGAMIPVEARLKSQGYQNLRRFDIQTRLMDSSLDVIYTSAQTLSTNIVNEPSNLAPTANVPPTNMYATIVFPPSPFDGSTVPGLTNVFYPQYVSITNGTITLQPGSYQIQVSGLTAQGNITYSIDFNQGSNVLSTVTYDNGDIKSSSFQAPLTDVILFPAVGTVLIDYILNISTESSFSLSIAASGITESNINIYNYVQ